MFLRSGNDSSACRAIACQLPSRGARGKRLVELCLDLTGLSDPTPTGRTGAASGWSDRELLERARRGEELAVEPFVRRMGCVPRILSVLNRRLGTQLDEHDLADLAQDTVVLVWRKLDAFDGSCTLETWAYGIARLEYMNALRRKLRARRNALELDVADSEAEQPSPAADGLAREELEGWLSELDPEESAVVRKKHFEGKTFEELAEELGISPNTAKTRYYRGIRGLQRKLGRTGHGQQEDA